MTKRQFSFLLGLVGQAGCAIYDEPLQRHDSDAATDALRDGPAVRDAAIDGARPDAVPLDAEASRDAGVDLGVPEDIASGEDARDGGSGDAGPGGNATDAAWGDVAHDAIVGPPDVSTPDALADAQSDATAGVDATDAGGGGSDVLSDATPDVPIVGCNVDFTVSGVVWEDDAPFDAGDGGDRVVRLVGNVGALGSWTPTSGLPMTEKAPGAWSAAVALPEEIALEFKFVKMASGRAAEWEWLPFDSNRSLLVECTADGGTVWVDAATDAGPANRAVGHSYGGAFGVRPLDATK
jgi:hypothetical protein